jgi:hypothetical protein
MSKQIARWLFVFASVLIGLLPAAPTAVLAATPPVEKKAKSRKKADVEKRHYIQVRRDDDDNPLSLDTAIVRMVPKNRGKKGLVVDLIGAVHVGEAEYYERLNKVFKSYDVLLFELVTRDKESVPRPEERRSGGGAIMALQGGMKSLLELEHQLDGIDYSAKNFVHADMTPEEFAQSMKDRGESFQKMFFRMMGYSIVQQSKNPAKTNDLAMLSALFADDRALRLKRLLAEQFEDLNGAMGAFGGPDGSTIITERNKKALRVLKEELAKDHKKIAIFYGAGHLEDFEERLTEDFGLRRKSIRWLSAWDLTE